MHHTEYLFEAARILTDREKEYGAPELCFDRIASIASTMLDLTITPYMVAQIHIATKLARAVESPGKADTWVDLINYVAFAGNFAAINARATSVQELDEFEKTVAETALAEVSRPDGE